MKHSEKSHQSLTPESHTRVSHQSLTPESHTRVSHQSLYIVCFSFLLISLPSCDKSGYVATPNVDSNVENYQNLDNSKSNANTGIKPSSKALNKFAKSFAKSMADHEFNKFVKAELTKEWGGDLQFLVHQQYNVPLNGEAKSFKSMLAANDLDPSSEDEIINSKRIRILATEHTYERLAKSDYGDLVVLIEPENEKSLTIEGYTIQGKPVIFSAKSEPEFPTFIVGYCEICNEQQASEITDKPKEDPSKIRRTNGYGEYVTWLQIPDLDPVESWWDGKPEMRLTAIVYNSNMSAIEKVKDAPLGGNSGSKWNRSSWQNGINFGTDPDFQSKGYWIFNWYYTQWHGTSYLVKIWELDDNGSQLMLTLVVGSYTFVYTGIKSGDDQLDEQQISYPNATPSIHNTGIMNYKINNIQ